MTEEGTSISGLAPGIVRRLRGPLGQRHVPGGLDEALELAVGDGMRVDPEPAHGHLVRRRFFRIVMVRSHQECPAGDAHHAGGDIGIDHVMLPPPAAVPDFGRSFSRK